MAVEKMPPEAKKQTCSKCGVDWPLGSEDWYWHSREQGFMQPCRRCRQEYARERARERSRVRTDRARRTEPRARTEQRRLMSRKRLAFDKAEVEQEHQLAGPRPATRGECVDGPRPCPWVSCRYHLALDVNPQTGNVKVNFPHLDVDEMSETCALDVADRSAEATLDLVGSLMNVTRERVRQIEEKVLVRLARRMAKQGGG